MKTFKIVLRFLVKNIFSIDFKKTNHNKRLCGNYTVAENYTILGPAVLSVKYTSKLVTLGNLYALKQVQT